jgi:ATP-dependent helicase HrpB
LGEEVGYAIRFDRVAGPNTKLLVMTEGLLTQRIQEDPLLTGIGAVILDEFHERSLHADLTLAMLKEIRESVREDLVVVVMSATLDPEPVAAYLGVSVLRCEGRAYPVERRYTEQDDHRSLEVRVSVAVRQMLVATDGDLLVFLPGAGEIAKCRAALGDLERSCDLLIMPLHGDLPGAEQDAVLKKATKRKIILSTNVAESAVTIEGITGVIDSGLARVSSFDPGIRSETLELKMISQANADQRAGRAGRNAPGVTLHLWSRAKNRALAPKETSPILRSDLSSTFLEVFGWGSHPERFPWFEPPLPLELQSGIEHLCALGAVVENRITNLGREILQLGAPPRLGVLMLEGARVGWAKECALAAAILSEKEVLYSARAFGRNSVRTIEGESDLLHRMELLTEGERRGRFDRDVDERTARTVLELASRWSRSLRKAKGLGLRKSDGLEQAMLRAFSDRLAKRREPRSESGLLVGGRGVKLDASSMVRSDPYFLCLSLLDGPSESRSESRVRMAHGVSEEALAPAFGDRFVTEVVAAYDPTSGRITSKAVTRIADLVIREKEGFPVPTETAEKLLWIHCWFVH